MSLTEVKTDQSSKIPKEATTTVANSAAGRLYEHLDTTIITRGRFFGLVGGGFLAATLGAKIAQAEPDISFQIINDPNTVPHTTTERGWLEESMFSRLWSLTVINTWSEYEEIMRAASIQPKETYRERFEKEVMFYAAAGKATTFRYRLNFDSIRHEWISDGGSSEIPGITVKVNIVPMPRLPQTKPPKYPYTIDFAPRENILGKTIASSFMWQGEAVDTRNAYNPEVHRTPDSKYEGNKVIVETARTHDDWENRVKKQVDGNPPEYNKDYIRAAIFLGLQPDKRKRWDVVGITDSRGFLEVILLEQEAEMALLELNSPMLMIDIPRSVDPKANKEVIATVVRKKDCDLLIVKPGDPIPPYPRCRDAGILSN